MSEIEAAWLRLALPRPRGAATTAGDAIAARYRAAAPHLRWQRRPPRPRATTSACSRVDRSTDVPRARWPSAASPPRCTTRWRSPSSRRTATSLDAACPQAEAWAAECVTVPCFPELTDAEVEHRRRGARERRGVTDDRCRRHRSPASRRCSRATTTRPPSAAWSTTCTTR